VRSPSLQPDDLLTIPCGFVDRLHALRFLRACDPRYRALTFTLVGLSPTGCISLLLDILFGSFLPSLRSSINHSLSGRGAAIVMQSCGFVRIAARKRKMASEPFFADL
jgi:hypothetical protein